MPTKGSDCSKDKGSKAKVVLILSWALKSLSDTQTVTHRRQKPSGQRVVWGHLQQSELSCLFRTCSRAHPSLPNLQLLDSLGIELGNALVVHWLRPCRTPNAGRPGSILGQELDPTCCN